MLSEARAEPPVSTPAGPSLNVTREGARELYRLMALTRALDTALAPAPEQRGTLDELRLTLGDRSVILKARVAHCSISDVDQELVMYRSGVEFVEPSERVFAVISSFIDAIKEGRRAL